MRMAQSFSPDICRRNSSSEASHRYPKRLESRFSDSKLPTRSYLQSSTNSWVSACSARSEFTAALSSAVRSTQVTKFVYICMIMEVTVPIKATRNFSEKESGARVVDDVNFPDRRYSTFLVHTFTWISKGKGNASWGTFRCKCLDTRLVHHH